MDEFDRNILELLQTDCRMTADAISEKVALSPAAIQKRLKKLRSDGSILSEVAVLNSAKLNLPMTVIVEVTLERESLDVLEKFKKQMLQAPNVQQCYYTTGDVDFVVIIIARDVHDYEKFTHEFFFGNKAIRKFKTNIVMDAVKVGLSVPVDYV